MTTLSAARRQSGTPLTETEVAASQRPPSQPNGDIDPGSDASDVEEDSADVAGAVSVDQQLEDPA